MKEKADLPEEGGAADNALQEMDSLQLRRADYGDANQIETFIEESKRSTYLRVYASREIMHLIETSYLAISVLSPDGNVVAFAAFDHSPIVHIQSVILV
jgi:predicted cupin superfamily sugar epimerase